MEPVQVRLGDEAVAELVAAFIAGATRAGPADQYGVSLSSVKRLLRSSGIRRRCGPVVNKPVQHRAGGSSPSDG